GHLLQVDRPTELWHRPASRRVAEFLGYEAFVDPASVAGAVLAGSAVPLAEAGGSAAFAVGPGSLVLDDDGPLRGTVRGSGFRRGVVELSVDVAGVGTVTVVEPSRLRTGAELLTVGGVVRLRAEPGAVAVVG
ncbi:MAG: ABC transporter ATP-binding protein, partial [Cellulomonadaceae bacterium]|nr:ABC transporter ATP-binding protein [Cellulomonadaceae bacterium]